MTVLRCPECKSIKIRKSGKMLTRSGRKQRYQCTRCARTFYKRGN